MSAGNEVFLGYSGACRVGAWLPIAEGACSGAVAAGRLAGSMSSSRIARAGEVLRLAELAARNLRLPSEEEDDSVRAKKAAFDSLVGKIDCLKKQASAQWKPEFESVLDSSHSMRVEPIDAAKSKELLRPLSFKCMACGRAEENCRFKIDLAGSFASSAWCREAADVTGEYETFLEEYEQVYSPEFEEAWSAGTRLPPVDRGVYVVGKTCLRKAMLRYTLQTLMMKLCYSADRELESTFSDRKASGLRRDRFYTVTTEKAEALLEKQTSLELAVADAKRHVAVPAVDHSFWAILDRVRSSVSAGDEATLDRLLVNRAVRAMSDCSRASDGYSHTGESEEDDCWSEGGEEESEDDVASEEEHAAVLSRRGSARRDACAADDQPMRTRSGATLAGPAARARAKEAPAAKRPRRAVVGDESEEEDAEQPAPPTPAPGPRQGSASGIAGINRAAGILPSRRDALIALMQLQTKLFVKRETADAVVCTNAIQTIQELMDRVERLSHTAGI